MNRKKRDGGEGRRGGGCGAKCVTAHNVSLENPSVRRLVGAAF